MGGLGFLIDLAFLHLSLALELSRQLDPDLMQGVDISSTILRSNIVAFPPTFGAPHGPMYIIRPIRPNEGIITDDVAASACGSSIWEEARVPLKLRGSRIPVRRRVTRKAASHQDAVPDPFVLRREVYHAVVKAAVAIEPNLDDVRGGQTQVRAGPDVREPLRRRRRSRSLHQIWVGVLFVIVRRDQEPAVLIF